MSNKKYLKEESFEKFNYKSREFAKPSKVFLLGNKKEFYQHMFKSKNKLQLFPISTEEDIKYDLVRTTISR